MNIATEIYAQGEVIRARLNESKERIADHLERTTQGFIMRMAIFFLAVASLAALIVITR